MQVGAPSDIQSNCLGTPQASFQKQWNVINFTFNINALNPHSIYRLSQGFLKYFAWATHQLAKNGRSSALRLSLAANILAKSFGECLSFLMQTEHMLFPRNPAES